MEGFFLPLPFHTVSHVDVNKSCLTSQICTHLHTFCHRFIASFYHQTQIKVCCTYRSPSDVVKKESAGRAAAVANIDCGGREACSTEDQKEASQENASLFPMRLLTSIPSRNVKRGIDQLLENI